MTKKALTPWNKHVQKTYAEGLKKNKDYKLKDAMKAASASWKSQSKSQTKSKAQKGGADTDMDTEEDDNGEEQMGGNGVADNAAPVMSLDDEPKPIEGGKAKKRGSKKSMMYGGTGKKSMMYGGTGKKSMMYGGSKTCKKGGSKTCKKGGKGKKSRRRGRK
jgi:hypothetical protein